MYIPEMQEWFYIHKPVTTIYHIKIIEDKNHIASDVGKTSYKIQHPFKIKTLNKLAIEVTYLNKIKAIYNKPTVFRGKTKTIIPKNRILTSSYSSLLYAHCLQANSPRLNMLIRVILLGLECILVPKQLFPFSLPWYQRSLNSVLL